LLIEASDDACQHRRSSHFLIAALVIFYINNQSTEEFLGICIDCDNTAAIQTALI